MAMVRDQELAEIQRSLGRIESALDAIKEDISSTSEKLDKHSERLGSLERRQHWYSGFAAAIGAIIGVGSGHLPKF